MGDIQQALSIAGLGIIVVFSVLLLLFLAIRVMGALAGDRTSESGVSQAGTPIDPHHLSCIVAAVRQVLGHVPSHVTVRRLD